MDLSRALSVRIAGEPERAYLLAEDLRLSVALKEAVPGETDHLQARVAYFDPSPIEAVSTGGHRLALVVTGIGGETASPIEPKPMVRLSGTDLGTGKPATWETMAIDVSIVDAAGKVLA